MDNSLQPEYTIKRPISKASSGALNSVSRLLKQKVPRSASGVRPDGRAASRPQPAPVAKKAPVLAFPSPKSSSSVRSSMGDAGRRSTDGSASLLSVPTGGSSSTQSSDVARHYGDGGGGLYKTESKGSTGARSFKSVESVPVTGTYPLGSLRVHRADEDEEMAGEAGLGAPLPATEAAAADASSVAGPSPPTPVLLILDLPQRFTLGLDALSLTVDAGRNDGGGRDLSTTTTTRPPPGQPPPPPPFLGLRELPPGAHLAWVSATEASTERSGCWFVIEGPRRSANSPDDDGEDGSASTTPAAVHVMQWDAYNEVLLAAPASRAEARFAREGAGEVYEGLLAYSAGGRQRQGGSAAGVEGARAKAPAGGEGRKKKAANDARARGRTSRGREALMQGPDYDDESDGTGPDADKGGGSDSGSGESAADDAAAAMWRRLTSHVSVPLLAQLFAGRGSTSTSTTAAGAGGNASAAARGPWAVSTGDGVRGDAEDVFLSSARGRGGGAATGASMTPRLGVDVATGAGGVGVGGGGAGSAGLNFLFARDGVTFDAAAVGRRRTETAVDATYYVLSVLDRDTTTMTTTPADLVFELQVSFLTAVHLGNAACLAQWWHLVLRVVLRAHALCVARPTLCRDLVETVAAQLEYCDRWVAGGGGGGSEGDDANGAAARGGADALDWLWMGGDLDGVGGARRGGGGGANNKERLREALVVYKRRLSDYLIPTSRGGSSAGSDSDDASRSSSSGRPTQEQASVGRAFSRLEAFLWRWDWDLRGAYVRAGPVMLEDGDVVEVETSELEAEDERGEYAAVVVQVDERGREVGLVSWD